MLILRIGGDEFALITGLQDREAVAELAAVVLAQNGQPVVHEGEKLPLALWCGMTRIPEMLECRDFLAELQQVVTDSKE